MSDNDNDENMSLEDALKMIGEEYGIEGQPEIEVPDEEPDSPWVMVSERMPDLVHGCWSESVILAYKVIGCQYRGEMRSAQYYEKPAGPKHWTFDSARKTVDELGYEPVAWTPMPTPPVID